MRVDDWDEDSGEEPVEEGAAPLAPPAPAAPPPVAPPAPVDPAAPRPRPALSAVLPIYIIGIVSVSLICVMFAVVMALIITR
jgi:hypothetical protein